MTYGPPAFLPWPHQFTYDRPLARLPLTSEAGNRELIVYEATSKESSAILQLRDMTTLHHCDGHTDERIVDHTLDLDVDAVLPLYALSNNPTIHNEFCTIRVLHNRGKTPVDYQFRSREDALELQKIATGYQTVAEFPGLTCSLVHRDRRLPFITRDARKDVIAEVQLWQPLNRISADGRASSVRTTSTASSLRSLQASIASEASDAVTWQSDWVSGRQAVVSFRSPPVLVLLGRSGCKHLLLKVDSRFLLMHFVFLIPGHDLGLIQSA